MGYRDIETHVYCVNSSSESWGASGDSPLATSILYTLPHNTPGYQPVLS